jgi:hypothetical protein
MAVTGHAESIVVSLAIDAALQMMTNGGHWSLVSVPDWAGDSVPGSDTWTDEELRETGALFQTTIRSVWDAFHVTY